MKSMIKFDKPSPVIISEGELYVLKEEHNHQSGTYVVLCTGADGGIGEGMFQGVVVYSTHPHFATGEWVDNFSNASFTKFYGEVILKSERS